MNEYVLVVKRTDEDPRNNVITLALPAGQTEGEARHNAEGYLTALRNRGFTVSEQVNHWRAQHGSIGLRIALVEQPAAVNAAAN